MNRTITFAFAISTLIAASLSAQAQDWNAYGNYTDVEVHELFTDQFASINGVNPDENTWSSPTSTDAAFQINGYANDGFSSNAGDGWTSYSTPYNPFGGADRSFGGDLFFFVGDWSPNPAVDGYTRISGLQPGAEYAVAMFSVIGGSKDTVFDQSRFGVTWSAPIDQPVIDSLAGNGADWLAHSTTDAIGTPGVKDGDTRFA